MLGGRLLLVEIIVLHLLEIDCEFGESFFEVFRVHRLLHEQELFVGKGVHKEHDPDVIDGHSTRGFRIKDGTNLATMVGEVMDELGEGTGLSDNEQLLKKTLRDSKARGP